MAIDKLKMFKLINSLKFRGISEKWQIELLNLYILNIMCN